MRFFVGVVLCVLLVSSCREDLILPETCGVDLDYPEEYNSLTIDTSSVLIYSSSYTLVENGPHIRNYEVDLDCDDTFDLDIEVYYYNRFGLGYSYNYSVTVDPVREGLSVLAQDQTDSLFYNKISETNGDFEEYYCHEQRHSTDQFLGLVHKDYAVPRSYGEVIAVSDGGWVDTSVVLFDFFHADFTEHENTGSSGSIKGEYTSSLNYGFVQNGTFYIALKYEQTGIQRFGFAQFDVRTVAEDGVADVGFLGLYFQD